MLLQSIPVLYFLLFEVNCYSVLFDFVFETHVFLVQGHS